MDDATAEMLSAQGVKIKEYENMAQRKFASKFPVKIIDANDNPFTGDIPRVPRYASVTRQARRIRYTVRQPILTLCGTDLRCVGNRCRTLSL